jgi:hypothetical protein
MEGVSEQSDGIIFEPKENKEEEAGGKCIMRSFMICTPY